MQKKLLLPMAAVALSTACVPAAYRVRPEPSPIGRWDHVAMLTAGAPVQVQLMRGPLVRGQAVYAGSTTLRLAAATGLADIAVADVMRVDRFEVQKAGATLRDAAKGAAVGAGMVGAIGLVKGRVPPAWQFVAGALVGSYSLLCVSGPARGPVTIYIAARALTSALDAR